MLPLNGSFGMYWSWIFLNSAVQLLEASPGAAR
jgi:hypothetical protein